MHNFPMEKV